jgi:hypothetical protein
MLYQKEVESSIRSITYILKSSLPKGAKILVSEPILNVNKTKNGGINITAYFETTFTQNADINDHSDLSYIMKGFEDMLFDELSKIYIDGKFRVKDFDSKEDFFESGNMIGFPHKIEYNSYDNLLTLVYANHFEIWLEPEEKNS